MIVIDASVAVKAYLEEVGSDSAIAVIGGEAKLLAPELIRLEVAAALCRRVRKGEMEAEDADIRCEHWFERLDQGLVALTPNVDVMHAAVTLANRIRHPLQDCLYLAAAQMFDVPLLTADRVFLTRAASHYARIDLLPGCETV